MMTLRLLRGSTREATCHLHGCTRGLGGFRTAMASAAGQVYGERLTTRDLDRSGLEAGDGRRDVVVPSVPAAAAGGAAGSLSSVCCIDTSSPSLMTWWAAGKGSRRELSRLRWSGCTSGDRSFSIAAVGIGMELRPANILKKGFTFDSEGGSDLERCRGSRVGLMTAPASSATEAAADAKITPSVTKLHPSVTKLTPSEAQVNPSVTKLNPSEEIDELGAEENPSGLEKPVSASQVTWTSAGVKSAAMILQPRVVLFDGTCVLCNAGVKWVIDRDKTAEIKFCAVQSRSAEPYLFLCGLTREEVLQRFVFIAGIGEWYRASTAAVQIAACLPFPYRLLSALVLIPTPIRDAVYDYVAARRYKWFGQADGCIVPDESVLDRFIDREEIEEFIKRERRKKGKGGCRGENGGGEGTDGDKEEEAAAAGLQGRSGTEGIAGKIVANSASRRGCN